jgi:hypothetical protein
MTPIVPTRQKLLFAFASVGLLIFVASAYGQTPQKVLVWADHPTGGRHVITTPPHQSFTQLDAIEILGISAGSKSIAIGEPFSANEDWLGELTIRIKNISDKELTGVQVTLVLLEMKKPPQVPYVAGCRHDHNQGCIRPGEEVELKIPVKVYEWVKSAVAAETELSRITKATIYDILVVLPGQVRWSSGCVKTKDPKQACPPHID